MFVEEGVDAVSEGVVEPPLVEVVEGVPPLTVPEGVELTWGTVFPEEGVDPVSEGVGETPTVPAVEGVPPVTVLEDVG